MTESDLADLREWIDEWDVDASPDEGGADVLDGRCDSDRAATV